MFKLNEFLRPLRPSLKAVITNEACNGVLGFVPFFYISHNKTLFVFLSIVKQMCSKGSAIISNCFSVWSFVCANAEHYLVTVPVK